MHTHTFTIVRRTLGNSQVLDLTDEIQAEMRQSRIRSGQAVAMVVGSTCALTTTEYEPGLAEHDLAAVFEKIAPEQGSYVHERTWGTTTGTVMSGRAWWVLRLRFQWWRGGSRWVRGSK